MSRRRMLFVALVVSLVAAAVLVPYAAWVGFVPTRMAHPTLGYAGCLQFFDVTLRGAAEEIEMEINAAYPGR